MKKRREGRKAFYVEISESKMEQLESHLDKKGQTKKEWLNEKIDEDLGK